MPALPDHPNAGSEASRLLRELVENGRVIVHDHALVRQVVVNATFRVGAPVRANQQPDGSFLVEVVTDA